MSDILVSLHGRDLGLDKDRYLTTRIGAKHPELYLGTSGSEAKVDIQDFTTLTAASTGTTISARGIATLGATAGANLTYAIAAPTVGLRKTIFCTGASTGQIVSSTGAAATFQSTGGSTHITATFPNKGSCLSLVGLSTGIWGVTSNQGVIVFA